MATKEQAAAALKALSNCFGAQRIPFFLDGGTLLGAIRDGDFCEDDHVDVDLTILEGVERLPAAIGQAALLGFELIKSWPHSGRGTMQLAVRRDGVKLDVMCKEIVRLNSRLGCDETSHPRQSVVAGIAAPPGEGRERSGGGVLGGGEYLYWTVYGKQDRVVAKGVPMDLVRGDRWVEFYGHRYRVPFKAEEYLTYRYGNWHVPVHRKEYSCYSTDLAILPEGTVVQR